VEEEGHGLIIQPDGQLVVGGFTNGNFALARYNPDGSLDMTFSGDGKVTLDLGGVDEAYALARQPDGKLVSVGESDGSVAVVRLNPDGAPDSTFDGDGIVITNLTNNRDHATGVAIQGDGKIVVGGYANYVDATSNIEFALLRYNPDGSLDPTFDGDGVVTTGFGVSADTATALARQPDGKLVLAGSSLSSTNTRSVALARYNPDGSLDLSFDGDGKVLTPVPGGAGSAQDLAVLPDGKLIIAGIANNADFLLARYTSAGALDTTFGVNGFAITDIAGNRDYAFVLAVQSDGKLVAGGQALFNDLWDMALARYTPDGILDASFGTGGKVRTDINNWDDFIYGIAQQPDGRLVVSGMTRQFTDDHFALARYGARAFEISKSVDDATPDLGQVITYTIVVTNVDVVSTTTAFISDTLPAEVTLAGPIALDPPTAGTIGTPPVLVSNVTLAVGQAVTVTIPVTVTGWPAAGALVTNTASVTSTQVAIPVTASIAIAVPAPPTPLDDFALTAIDTPVTIFVLSNDSDPNGDALAVTGVGLPMSGTVSADGVTVTYTPTLGFLGADVFTYIVSDGIFARDASVTVLVAQNVYRIYMPLVRR
jgi:uncharacterized delta-60 repeat protein/uncharacterized repeat protein (TIGR01451 family)